jgi:hypothetical protein
MKYEQYKNEFIDLKYKVISAINHKLINDNAAEIEFHNGIIHNWIDDQQNEVIKRFNVETANVLVDTGYDSYFVELSKLDLDKLLAILEMIEAGSYEVWEELEK